MKNLLFLGCICLIWWQCGKNESKPAEEVAKLQSELLSCLQANKVLTEISAKDLPDTSHYQEHCTQNELSEILKAGKCRLDKCMKSTGPDQVANAIKECASAKISQTCRGGARAF